MRKTLLALVALAASCGAAPPPVETSRSARAEPLPMAENQQGTVQPIALAAVAPLAPPIPGVYLWCAAPTGRACRAATAALGTGPKETSGLPPSLLNVEDLSDDCLEPTIATVGRRLAPALAVSQTGWRDQSGSMLDPSMLGDMYQAAGCINDVDQALPIAKISAGSTTSPRVYLVRVWDAGEASY